MNPAPTPIEIIINKVVTKADYAVSLLSVLPPVELTAHYITLQRIQAKLAETFKAVATVRAYQLSQDHTGPAGAIWIDEATEPDHLLQEALQQIGQYKND